MTSLVAYYGSGSDEEDNEMDTEHEQLGPSPSSSRIHTAVSSSATSTSVIAKDFSGKGSTDDDDVDSLLNKYIGDVVSANTSSNLKLESVLPQPKATAGTDAQRAPVEIGPIPPKKVYGDEEQLNPRPSAFPNIKTSKSAKGTVQISIPLLKNLGSDDDESFAQRKVFQGSQKGCGLFALLPQPKNDSLFQLGSGGTKHTQNNGEKSITYGKSEAGVKPTLTQLIPQALRQGGKRPATTNQRLVAKYMKHESNFRIVSRSASTAIEEKAKDDSDEDEEGSSGDFFSLEAVSGGDHRLEASNTGLPSVQPSIHVNIRPEVEDYVDPNVYEMEMETLPTPFEHPVQTVAPGPDLMKFIQPTRKERGIPAEINIIDVSADDLRPQTTDWLKTITDTSIIPPRKAVLPGGMTKRKHQITYLAAEAKAREEELQNQWASNRQARRQTQNKYGF